VFVVAMMRMKGADILFPSGIRWDKTAEIVSVFLV
jgi:hypothetical protein